MDVVLDTEYGRVVAREAELAHAVAQLLAAETVRRTERDLLEVVFGLPDDPEV